MIDYASQQCAGLGKARTETMAIFTRENLGFTDEALHNSTRENLGFTDKALYNSTRENLGFTDKALYNSTRENLGFTDEALYNSTRENLGFRVEVLPNLTGWNTSGVDLPRAEIFNMTADDYLQMLNREFADKVLPAVVWLLVLMVLGAIGNLFVLVVYSCKSKRGTITRFIQALAVFDLLSCCLAIPGEIVDMSNNYTFGSDQLCKVIRTVNLFCTVASGATLVVVAIDRYKRICCPMRRQISPKGAVIILSSCALASMLISLPTATLYGGRTVVTGWALVNGTDCSISDRFAGTMVPLAYNSLQMLLFLVGAITLIILYSLVGSKVCRHVHQQQIRRKSFCLNRSRFSPGQTSMFSSCSTNMDNHCRVEPNIDNPATRENLTVKCKLTETEQEVHFNITIVTADNAEEKCGPKNCKATPEEVNKTVPNNNKRQQNRSAFGKNSLGSGEKKYCHACCKDADQSTGYTNCVSVNGSEPGKRITIPQEKCPLDAMGVPHLKNSEVEEVMDVPHVVNSEVGVVMDATQVKNSEDERTTNVPQTKNSNVDVPQRKKSDVRVIIDVTEATTNATQELNSEVEAGIDLSLAKNSEVEAGIDLSLAKNSEVEAGIDLSLAKNSEVEAGIDLSLAKNSDIEKRKNVPQKNNFKPEIIMNNTQIMKLDMCLYSAQKIQAHKSNKETHMQTDDFNKKRNHWNHVPQNDKVCQNTSSIVSTSEADFNHRPLDGPLSSNKMASGTSVQKRQRQSGPSCEITDTKPETFSSNRSTGSGNRSTGSGDSPSSPPAIPLSSNRSTGSIDSPTSPPPAIPLSSNRSTGSGDSPTSSPPAIPLSSNRSTGSGDSPTSSPPAIPLSSNRSTGSGDSPTSSPPAIPLSSNQSTGSGDSPTSPPPAIPPEKLANPTRALLKAFGSGTKYQECKDVNACSQRTLDPNIPVDRSKLTKSSLLNCFKPRHGYNDLNLGRTKRPATKTDNSQTKHQHVETTECERQRQRSNMLNDVPLRGNVKRMKRGSFSLSHRSTLGFLKENSEAGRQAFGNIPVSGTEYSDTQGEDERENKRKRLQTNGTKRATLMLFLITIIYVLSFLPHLVLMAIKALNENSLREHGESWELAENLLIRSYFINSMANPIIYSFFSKNFFRECKKSVSCCHKKSISCCHKKSISCCHKKSITCCHKKSISSCHKKSFVIQ